MSQTQTFTSNGGDVLIPLLINSTAETPTDTFPVISPATSSTVWHCASASTSLAVRAVNSCADALPAWSATKPSTRRTILLKAADILQSRIAEGADLLCKETGTDEGAAEGFVMSTAVNLLRHVAGQIDGVCGRIVDAAGEGESGIVLKEPIGVVLGVVAWNAPPVFTVRAAATAIAAGCTVIIKSSELAPATVNFVAKAFYDAGLPAGVLNVIHARRDAAAEVVSAMIKEPAVRKVNFTGSAAVGRQIAGLCGQSLKPCLMELGGKNSAIVCEDAELNGPVEGSIDAVGEVFRGSFLNSGQICMATDRILVQESIAEDFTSRLKSTIEKSNSQRHPVLISEASKKRVVSLLRDALEKGATLITGFDLSSASTEDISATSMPITLLRNVPSTALAASEEWFAPVASIETFKDIETAIAIANSANANSSLSSSVFTRDLRKALKIAKQIKTGAVHINGMSIHDDPTMPHGGVGESGWGRFNAREGIEEFLVSKGITWRD